MDLKESSSILKNAANISTSDLIKKNPKLNAMYLNHLQFWKVEGDEAWFLGLIGKSLKGPQSMVEFRFKDTGDELRLTSTNPIKDLPLTYFSGVEEISKRIK